MAHVEQQNFCKKMQEIFPEYFENKKVLDIGSLDVNGNNRFLFTNCNYIGLDVGEGSNVDIVCLGNKYDAPDQYFDTIISTEVFEHDMFYEETIQNIIRMLKPGGAFIFTCASTGRPEHGTRRCGESCAPLLIQISEEWADYYKNLTEDDIKKIKNFESHFPDGIFEFNEAAGDLYFFGVKGGIKNSQKYKLKPVDSIIDSNEYTEDIFVVGCWPDTEEKENTLIDCIQRLKEFHGIPILLASHYPVKPQIQSMVDFYLYDNDNPLLRYEEYEQYGISSAKWFKLNELSYEGTESFHHDYAIWVLMQKAFKFCDNLGKKTIHYLEYDNIIDTFQYRQSFLEKSKNNDVVIYEYIENSSSNMNLTEYMATYIFSIKTDIALKTLSEINSKWDYFHNRPGGFQLERIFLSELKKYTNNIYISPYIANNNELNTHAVWNRDGIIREDTKLQIALGVDDTGDLYLVLVSGFTEEKVNTDYLLEIKYDNTENFYNLIKDHFSFLNLGKYKKGKTVRINYMGKEIFKEYLGNSANDFKKLNNIVNTNKPAKNIETEISYNFIDGPYLSITTNDDINDIQNSLNEFEVEFIDDDTNEIHFSNKMNANTWSRCSKKYFVNWKVRVITPDKNDHTYFLNLNSKRVFISMESKAIGDTLAWLPYVEEFRKKWNCNLIVSSYHKELYETEYPEIEWVNPGDTVYDLYACYRLGIWDNGKEYDKNIHINNPNEIPLQKVACDILGLEYTEIKPKIKKINKYISEKPYICIGIHSTAQTKYWNNPTGWQELVDYTKDKGYDVYLLSKEEDGYMGNKYPDGVIHIKDKSIEEIGEYLLGSQGFVGISSGLSWYSWALNIPTILISGFTPEHLEMQKDVVRIINKEVCNGCWARHIFDRGDWNWCPEHKETERQFECSKSITFEMVKPHLDNFFEKITE